jgi:hypothetical protein
MQMELAIRFEYGTVVPWVTRVDDGRLRAVAGPDQILFAAPVDLRGEDFKTRADFRVEEGQTVPFTLTWSHSFGALPRPLDAAAAVENVTRAWKTWSGKHTIKGPYADAILSLDSDAEGSHSPRDGRHRGSRHHFPTRGNRRSSQLGLSLLLAARRHLHCD